jgi:hypothetical protein
MKFDRLSPQSLAALACVQSLPKKMLQIHGIDNATEFVLHELCHAHCFNLKRAAYFVDNPDFNRCRGVAGFVKEESFSDDFWNKMHDFSRHMQKSPFNQRVRECEYETSAHKPQDFVGYQARRLTFVSPQYVVVPVKNGNHGIFIYEYDGDNDDQFEALLTEAIPLLGFCPVF